MGRRLSRGKSVQKANGRSVRKVRTLRRFVVEGVKQETDNGGSKAKGSKPKTLKRFPYPEKPAPISPIARPHFDTLSSIYDSPAAMTRKQYFELREGAQPEFVRDHQIRITSF